MRILYNLNTSGDMLVLDINEDRMVTITIGQEECTFFLDHEKYKEKEMTYMRNFLEHRLAMSMANSVYNEVSAMVEFPKLKHITLNAYGRKYKHYYIKIYDEKWNLVFERTDMFFTKEDAKNFGRNTILKTGKGMKSRIVVRRA